MNGHDGLIFLTTLLTIAVFTIQNRRIHMDIQIVEARVAAQDTVIDSAITLLNNIHGELQAAINANDPVKIQALADHLQANTIRLASAVQANTDAPAAEPTVEPNPAPEPPPTPVETGSGDVVLTEAPPADAAPADGVTPAVP